MSSYHKACPPKPTYQFTWVSKSVDLSRPRVFQCGAEVDLASAAAYAGSACPIFSPLPPSLPAAAAVDYLASFPLFLLLLCLSCLFASFPLFLLPLFLSASPTSSKVQFTFSRHQTSSAAVAGYVIMISSSYKSYVRHKRPSKYKMIFDIYHLVPR